MNLMPLAEIENKCAWNLVRVYGLGYSSGVALADLQRQALKHALAVVGLGLFNAELNYTFGKSCFWHNEETGHGFLTKEDNDGNVGIYPLTVPDDRVYTAGYWEAISWEDK